MKYLVREGFEFKVAGDTTLENTVRMTLVAFWKDSG
jgi:hypothetical protein